MKRSRTFAAAGALCIVLAAAPAQHRAGAQSFPDILAATVRGDTVTISDSGAVENCAARFRITLEANGAVLVMRECDTVGPLADCICSYALTASMTGLPAGSYRCDILREYRKRYQYGTDTTIAVGSVDFAIAAPGGGPVPAGVRQSPCGTTDIGPRTPPARVDGLAADIAPHPVAAGALLRIAAQPGEAMTVALADLSGRRIAAFPVVAGAAGDARIPLVASTFPSNGVYLCTIAGRRMLTIPFVVLRP